MATVQTSEQTIRRRLRRARNALLCGGAMAFAQVVPAPAQDLGTLRSDTTDQQLLLLKRSTTTTAADTGIPSASYDPVSQGALADTATVDTPDFGDLDLQTTASTDATDPTVKSPIEPVVPPSRERAERKIGPLQGEGVAPESDPFAATGLRLGTFTLKPTLELGLTGSRETTASSSGTPPVITRATANNLLGDSTLRLELTSDWDRHALNVTASGRLQKTLHGGASLEPSLDIAAGGRIDIGKDTTLSLAAGYNYALDDPKSAGFYAATDPLLIPALSGTNKPATQTFDGSATLRHDFGGLFGEVGLSAARTIYGAARLSDGSTVSQHDLDNTVYDARLRGGYEISPALSPFAEISYGIRRMDVSPDTGGYDRDAMRYALRLGTEFDLGEKLNGEVAAGYLMEDIDDPALEDIAGLSVDATVNWSPRRETDVKLALRTTTETSGSAGDSGALLYSADLGITHRVRANLTAEAGFGAEYRDELGGTDKVTLNGSASLTYWFNRFAGVTTRIGHEQKLSSNAASRSNKTTAFIGLKLQR